uniref:Palmitoyltransferase n=1 Tax=Salmo trutta TaxID=8032 RepID=A0A673WPD2_SALTR
VTKKRRAGQLQAYPCDKRMFHPGIMYNCHYYCLQTVLNIQCFPFVLSKSLQQVCDHHCVWVNNCIRAQNTWYFLLYLLGVCVMAADMSGILRGRYVDDDGQQRHAGMLFVIQHLFLIFLRIVFILGFLVVVFKLLAGYAMFYTFLALVNQTSNEWYKGRGNVCQHCHPSPDHFCGPPASDQSKRWFYSRGVLRNLGYFWSCSKKDN